MSRYGEYTLEQLVEIIQFNISKVNGQRKKYEQEQEEKWVNTQRDKNNELRDLIQDKKATLERIDTLLNTLKSYYSAYYEDASFEAKLGQYPPKQVDMNAIKMQLANTDRQEAASIIIKEVKGGMAYLQEEKTKVGQELKDIEESGRSKDRLVGMKEQLSKVGTEEFFPEYKAILCSEEMEELVNRALSVGKYFNVESWEKLQYIPPQRNTSKLIIGRAKRKLDIPSKLEYLLAENPLYAGDSSLYIPVGVTMNSLKMLVKYHINQFDSTKGGIRTLIGNMLTRVKPKETRVYMMDLELMNAGALGGLVRLMGDGTAYIADVPKTKEELTECLNLLLNEMNYHTGLLAGYHDVDEYNADVDEDQRIKKKIIIAYGCPEKLDNKSLELFQKIYYMSAQCGVSIVVIHNCHADVNSGEAKVFYNNMQEQAFVIESDDRGQYLKYKDEKSEFIWQQGLNMLSQEFINQVNSAYITRIIKKKVNVVDTYDKFSHCRGNKTLTLPFGVNENDEIQNYDISPNSVMNFAAYVSGSAGSGKSTLLHTLIAGILTKCHPEDVDLWLIDFKMTEFQLYAKHRPPHLRRLVLENSQEVVLDIIDELTNIMESRMRLFAKRGIKDIFQLPEEVSLKHIPLQVVVVDEFATMSQIVQMAPMRGDISYKTKLENLLAKGRALGFRFIFSDQSYNSGISGLSEKTRNQIGYRFALANASQDEMKATLNLPSYLKTEEIAQWQAKLPPHIALTAEKHRASEDSLEISVKVHRTNITYLKEEKIVEIIGTLNKMYRPVNIPELVTDNTYLDKKVIIVDGQSVSSFESVRDEIKQWDDEHEFFETDKRIYMGRPCSLKTQNPIVLQEGLGENVVIFLSDRNKMASLLLAALNSSNQKKTVISYKQDYIFRKFGNHWRNYKCLSELEDICSYIAVLKEKIDRNQFGSEIILCLGIYNLYQEWRELPKKRLSSTGRTGSDEPKNKTLVEPKPVVSSGKGIFSLLSEAGIGFEFEKSDMKQEMEMTSAGHSEDVKEQEGLLYNAIEDFAELLKKGTSKGYNFIIPLDQYETFKELKWSEKMFHHIVYNGLTRNEVAMLVGVGKDANIPQGAVRYVNKQEGYSIRPYLFDGIQVDGWILDSAGQPVMADIEDEFI